MLSLFTLKPQRFIDKVLTSIPLLRQTEVLSIQDAKLMVKKPREAKGSAPFNRRRHSSTKKPRLDTAQDSGKIYPCTVLGSPPPPPTPGPLRQISVSLSHRKQEVCQVWGADQPGGGLNHAPGQPALPLPVLGLGQGHDGTGGGLLGQVNLGQI